MQDYNYHPPRQQQNQSYGAAPQYPPRRTPQSVYQQPGYTGHYPFDQNNKVRKDEKAGIKKLALISGLCMLGYLLAQLLFSSIVTNEQIWSLYSNDYYFESGIDIIYSVFVVGLPFFLMYLFTKKQNIVSLNNFAKPKGVAYTTAMIFMGFGLCILSSYITNFLYTIIESTGVTLPYDDFTPPLEPVAIALLFIKTAVVPALIEEFAIRGFLLQSMRRYGDDFAIVMSSLVFSLMHANAVQIIFAFMAGLALGYVYCKTNSIWTCIIVHFLNNAFSCTEVVILAALPQEKAATVGLYMTFIVGVLALISLFLIFISKNYALKKTYTYLESGQKAKAFITQPVFIIMAILFLSLTMQEVYITNI